MTQRRKSRSKAAPADEALLPEAELEVLACLHGRGESDARTIREAMEPYRPLAHSSVMTLLQRLEAKALVARRRAPTGKAFLFRATRNSASTYGKVLGRLLNRVFSGDRLSLVSTLFRGGAPSEEEIRRLSRLVEELHLRREKRKG